MQNATMHGYCIQPCRKIFQIGRSNEYMTLCKHAAARVVWGHAPTGKLDVRSVIAFKASLGQKQLLE